jgi:hypothetical protein
MNNLEEKIKEILDKHVEHWIYDKELAHMGIKSEVRLILKDDLIRSLVELITAREQHAVAKFVKWYGENVVAGQIIPQDVIKFLEENPSDKRDN